MAEAKSSKKQVTSNKSAEKYNPTKIEPKWQAVWEQEKIYQPDLDTASSSTEFTLSGVEVLRVQQPFYNLMMFPYPSAEGLHVGNVYAFTGADVYGRFKRMQGHEVFEPIGLDGFGIHSENYALKVGSHPMDQTEKSEKNFYRQLHAIGNSYDWSRTVETYKPDYYKWTQWVFIELFKAGLAYRAEAKVNWCPSCKTVLADEQVIDGKCERCGSVVEKRDLKQWFFRITGYAERLLQDLDKIDWTEKVKIAQRNWIGKSTGASIRFEVPGVIASEAKQSQTEGIATSVASGEPPRNDKYYLEVFTTRPDTLYGATFMVISPEHPLVASLLSSKLKVQKAKLEDIEDYIQIAQSKTDQERVEVEKEKTGVFSGAYAINPVTGKAIPIWIADYVLMGYGTGAIMAVPAHDQRDFEFAKKYNLPIIPVIEAKYVAKSGDSAVKAGEPFVKREAVCAIVRDPKTEKYLCISWKKFHMNGLVTGGVEPGEDPIEAAMREIREETGYKNIRFLGDTGVFIHSLFYHRQKKENRWARFHYLEFELENDEREPVAEEEQEKLEVVWKSPHEFKDFFSVIEGELLHDVITRATKAFAGEGVIANSEKWNGWEIPEAKEEVIEWIEKKGYGRRQVEYHLRDWLISRQRYWGAPIPMIYCEACAKAGKSWFTENRHSGGSKATDRISQTGDAIASPASGVASLQHDSWDSAGWYVEEALPVILPKIDDYRPVGTGKAPLANHPEFFETTCPRCGSKATRETDVSDTFLDSSWYFFRYLATDWDDVPFPSEAFVNSKAEAPNPKQIQNTNDKNSKQFRISDFDIRVFARAAWLPVDQYTGGAEHSVLHLLYSRFVTKVFHDLGMITFDEPFPKFFAHGLIIKERAKMSKSKGNVVVPDEYIKKYGADTLRTYLMFLGPFSDGGDFQDSGIEGIHRFLKRVWTLFTTKEISGTQAHQSAKVAMHRTIKGVSLDLNSFRYNTAIAKIMTWYNFLSDQKSITKEELQVFLQLLAPFAPHMTEELWQQFHDSEKKFDSIHVSSWPQFDDSLLVDQTITIAVQVNGKLRDTIEYEKSKIKDQKDIEELAKNREKVKRFIDGKEIKKVIFVPGKILNFVLK